MSMLSDFSDEIRSIIEEIVTDNPNDITRATHLLYDELRNYEEFNDAMQAMVLSTVRRELVNGMRTLQKRRLRQQIRSGSMVIAARVIIGNSPVVAQSAGAMLNSYYIDGKCLGDCTREDLLVAQGKYSRLANAFRREARFCEELLRIIPDHGTVRDHLSDTEARDTWEYVWQEILNNGSN